MRQSWTQAIALAVLLLFALYLFSVNNTTPSARARLALHTSSPPPAQNRTTHNPYGDGFLQRHEQSYSHTLVLAKLKDETVTWAEDDLANMPIARAFYNVDDPEAFLHTPLNKGNEAMAYLTYIIDFYNILPNVSTFMHSHAEAWHNNDLLERSSAVMLRRLSLEKVVREGYVNLRCHLNPGCPSHILMWRPEEAGRTQYLASTVLAAFKDFFPKDKLPEVLSQPCCAQFAVSSEAIHRHPKAKYVAFRQWLIDTELRSEFSGRVFEYLWQYIFTSRPVLCPSIQLCYCDTYSVCFPTAADWEDYHALLESIETVRRQNAILPSEEHERKEALRHTLDTMEREARERKTAALTVGFLDQKARQRILFDAWNVLQDLGEL